MNRLSRLAFAGLLISAAAFAQTATCNSATVPVCTNGTPSGDVQIKPQAIPTSAATVTTSDAYLKTVTLTNTTGSAVIVTLADRQASPISLSISVAANSVQVINWNTPYWCPAGFTMVAASTGVNIQGSWKQ